MDMKTYRNIYEHICDYNNLILAYKRARKHKKAKLLFFKYGGDLSLSANIANQLSYEFPEKINGEYVIFHRLWPKIVVDTVTDLSFGEGRQWLKNESFILPRHSYWDSQKLSIGATPIKTEDGWLVIYNAVDRRDPSRYKVGAMLLDLKNPKKVLARTREPILSPDEWYENAGKPHIIYAGGAVLRDGLIYIYYGGADRVSCVATVSKEDLLKQLKNEAEPAFKFKEITFN